jgi:hypothetical protein
MNVNELRRNELRHLEVVIKHLERLAHDKASSAGCFINKPAYWRSRVLQICPADAEPDIQDKARRLLTRLSAISGG